MMRNRAGLLALAVLAIAILLMVFVVMPRIGGDASKVGDAINQAGSEVKNTVEEAGKTARNALGDAAATTEKVGRLTADAGQSLTELKALFADGKTPAADAFAAAKAKASGALKAIADFAVPDGTDAATASIITKAKDGASKALATIQALSENAADALAALTKAEAELTGNPAPQPNNAATPDATAQQPAASAPAADQANAGPKLPAFDVLRVEPDGSTVIAGSAEPNGKLEIMDGDKVVTTTDVGPTGDFAAVLDNPLPPGDHQLVLKVTGKDGKSQISEEVATVSVPKDGSSTELLAMVSKPGTASRLITTPKTEQQIASADGTPPALPSASSDIANTAPAIPGTAQPAASAAPAEVMVSAVEIEGNKIFVAGTAKANANVLAYADDKLIGKATAGGDGHFVIDGSMNLAVGDHKIRVDIVDGAGKVLVRASVVFNRPEGDQVTVAAQTPPAAGNTAAPAATTAAPAALPLDEGEFSKLRADAGKAFALLKGLFADGKLPGAEQLAAARSATEFALRSIVDFRPAADATPEFKQTTGEASQSASGALTMLLALPRDAKSVGDALGKLAAIIDGLTATPAPQAPAVAPATNEVATGGETGPKTIEQAPLTTSNNTVIIRRGDTLWQISRRVYGAGVRYTTIYMANEDEIRNPDRILPGQIFGVPKDALPNSEELHRKLKAGEQL